MHQTSDDYIVIVEVGPRDGLQNEAAIVSTDVKIELVKRLARAGLDHIEATAFVSPKWVPQMADSTDVMRACASAAELSRVTLSALTPNLKGFEAAIAAGSREVAVFASASETFSRRNINCSIDDSFTRFEPIFEAARAVGIPVRGYVSCVIACPYEGAIDPRAVARVSRLLLEKGAREISLATQSGLEHLRRSSACLKRWRQRHPYRRWQDISTTPMAWGSPIFRPHLMRASVCSTAPSVASAAALMPQARLAMLRQKKWSICCKTSACAVI